VTVRQCIIYVRVSTEDQARKGYSLPDQIERCTRRAAELGYGPDQVAVLKDEGFSGELIDRPGLNRLRELVAEPGAVGHVVVMDPDRLARNLSLQLVVTDEIVRGGIGLEFTDFEWKNTPEGRLFYSLRGAIAEYEKAKIKERTRRGREQKAKQGLMPVGKDLYGFKFNPDSDKLEPVEAEQAVLRLIRDLVLYGPPGTNQRPLSCVQSARWLAAHGVPAPRGNTWYASTIARMLRNEAYTGNYWVFKTDTTSGKRKARPREQQYLIRIPAVWDVATREALVQRVESNRWLERGRKSEGHFLLKGLIYCGVCGDGATKMRGHSVVDQRRNYHYYICCRNTGRAAFDTATGERVKCPSRHWPAGALDEAVWNAVKEAVRSPGRVLEAYNAQRQDLGEVERVGNELAALQAALDQKGREEARYLRLFALGHIASEQKLDEALGPVRREIATLRERLADGAATLASMQQAAAERDGAGLTVQQVQRAVDSIREDDVPAKREFLVRLLKRVVVGNDGVAIVGYLGGDRATGCHDKGSAVRQLE
jgi:site-specific DNA recombinase